MGKPKLREPGGHQGQSPALVLKETPRCGRHCAQDPAASSQRRDEVVLFISSPFHRGRSPGSLPEITEHEETKISISRPSAEFPHPNLSPHGAPSPLQLKSMKSWGPFPGGLLCAQLSTVLGPKGCVPQGQEGLRPPELPAGRQNRGRAAQGVFTRKPQLIGEFQSSRNRRCKGPEEENLRKWGGKDPGDREAWR